MSHKTMTAQAGEGRPPWEAPVGVRFEMAVSRPKGGGTRVLSLEFGTQCWLRFDLESLQPIW